MEESILQGIDALVGGPTVCALTTEPVKDELLLKEGFTAYAAVNDWNSRSFYEKSRWVRRDEDGRIFPELLIYGCLKYGPLDGTWAPYWMDKNYLHSSISNVLRLQSTPKKAGSKYGRAGTPEYRKNYFGDPENKARLREQTRASALRKRLVVAEAKRRQKEGLPGPKVEAVVNDLEKLASSLLGPDQAKAVMGGEVAMAAIELKPPCPRCGTDLEPTTGKCPWCGWSEDLFNASRE